MFAMGKFTSVYVREFGRDKARPREPLFSGNHSSDKYQCIVDGIDGFVLRVSSFFGMAPLRFKPSGKGYVVSLSHYMCIYSYLLITVVAAIALVGTALKMKIGIDPSQHIFTYMSQVVSLCDILLVAFMVCVGVYGAPSRMRTMLQVMDTIASVDKCIGFKYSRARLFKLWTAMIFFLFYFTVLIVYDIICCSAYESEDANRKWAVVLHYLGVYMLWYLVMILEVQFAFTVISVQTRFQAVNKALSLTAKHISLQNMSGEPHLVVSPSDEVHRIASLHSALCDVVHNINKSYSVPLVFMLISTVLRLITSPYFIILEINDVESNNLHFIILEALWIIFHVLRLFLMEEPCHFTAAEGRKTESLVSRMLLESPNSGPLLGRLELFSHQLMLQTLSYRPMGLFMLDRPLVASIFGAVATYLLLLVQFLGN